MVTNSYEHKCVSCMKMTRHKSGTCDVCRKNEQVICSHMRCKKKAVKGDLCNSHHKSMMWQDGVLGRVTGGGELLDPAFDEMLY